MTYDLKITGGTLIDGTGREKYSGDIGIKDGKIVAVGDAPDAADRTIDAAGATVTPGFTDIHTHYDGQISWDEEMAPSSIHGVTTCVMGSCGVGFAPVRPADHGRLIELMEGVEDIPGSALAEGLTWEWETFPQYLDAIDSLPHTIDFAAQVPHDALRVYVMGERAVAEERATEEDIATMSRLLRESLQAGAAGFSTARTDNHRTARGAATPASEAMEDELVGIARGMRGLSHGVLQGVSDFDMAQGPDRFDPEFDLFEAMARAAERPMSMSCLQRDQAGDQWRQILSRVQAATDAGLDMHVQVAARAIGIMLGLEATFHPFMGFPSYKEIAHLPLAERVKAMRDPARKARMLTESSEPVAGDGSPIPKLADQLLANIDMIAMRLYQLGEEPNYEPDKATCMYAKALQTGEPILGVIYDALLEEEGRALLYFPLFNYGSMNLDYVHEMLAHPRALCGLSDAGAHVGTVCDGSMPTFLLSHWGREREKGFSLEKLVKMQAHDTSRFIGFHDRGTLEVGMRADINVLDMSRLALHAPRLHADLPAGGKRLLQGADGYIATLVNGVAIAENGKLTGTRPGRLVRVGH